jgi:hypothetical protein
MPALTAAPSQKETLGDLFIILLFDSLIPVDGKLSRNHMPCIGRGHFHMKRTY